MLRLQFLRRCLARSRISISLILRQVRFMGYRDGSWDHVDPAARPPSLAGEDRLIQAIDLAGKPASGAHVRLILKRQVALPLAAGRKNLNRGDC